jgi:hypothetical protein
MNAFLYIVVTGHETSSLPRLTGNPHMRNPHEDVQLCERISTMMSTPKRRGGGGATDKRLTQRIVTPHKFYGSICKGQKQNSGESNITGKL